MTATEIAREYVYDDGGRAAAGFKGETGDCVCRAVAIATEQPYQVVYDALNEMAKRERPGVNSRTGRRRPRSNARTGGAQADGPPVHGVDWLGLDADHGHRLRDHGPPARGRAARRAAGMTP